MLSRKVQSVQVSFIDLVYNMQPILDQISEEYGMMQCDLCWNMDASPLGDACSTEFV